MQTDLNGLTQDRLKHVATYNPITGTFIANVDRGKRIKKGDILGYSWQDGYVEIMIDSKKYLAHRLAFLYMLGKSPIMVDHIDHNKTNNSWTNLREATNAQNQHNSVLSTINTTGIKGLSYYKTSQSYYGCIRKNGKLYRKGFSCGTYGYEHARELAIQWIQETREQLHGEFTNHG